jgi:hypothetical protein
MIDYKIMTVRPAGNGMKLASPFVKKTICSSYANCKMSVGFFLGVAGKSEL